ncbi:hypothetical protein PLO_2107, partial [Pediococcus acidilactici NGRI 0510Q]
MSKRKIWNVNEKKHYKMYKSGKQWFFAGMGIVAGLFGAGSTTIASADETPKGANLDLSKSKNLLATKTSATIPGSTSNTNSQNANSTHNSVTNSASTANQNTQASASQSASKAASASLSASLKASQAASQQKASQSKSQQAVNQASDQAKQASEKAKQQAAKTDTKKASNANSQQHSQADSQQDSTNQQSKSVTKQSTNNGSQTNVDNSQSSTSIADTNSKSVASQNSTQSSQSLSISASNSMKDSQSRVTVDQSASLSQSLTKSNKDSTKDTPIWHGETFTGNDGKTISDAIDYYGDADDVHINEPPTFKGYVNDFSQAELNFGILGTTKHIDGVSDNPSEQEKWFTDQFRAFVKTAKSIDEINDWIHNNIFYKLYVEQGDFANQKDGYLNGWSIDWVYNKQDDLIAIKGKDINTTVGNPKSIRDGLEYWHNSAGEQPDNLDGLSWDIDEHPEWWNEVGDHKVEITYFDSSSLESVKTTIIIHVVDKAVEVNAHGDTVYEGAPKGMGEFIDGAIDSNGNPVEYNQDTAKDFGWSMDASNWYHTGSYTVNVTYTDPNTKDTAVTTITINVVANNAKVEGKDTIYNMGNPHLTINDLLPNLTLTEADGTTVENSAEALVDNRLSVTDLEGTVDWDDPGTYYVTVHYTDKLSGKEVTGVIGIKVVGQGVIKADDGNTWKGEPLDPAEVVTTLKDSHGDDVLASDVENVRWSNNVNWNIPGTYSDVELSYTDKYGVTITTTITVTVNDDQDIQVRDGVNTWEGKPLTPQQVVSGLTDTHGEQDNDLSNVTWDFDDTLWDVPGEHTATLYYTDKYGNTVSKEVTIVVNEDKTSIDGSNYETTTGNTPTLSDVNASATDANGDPVDLSEIKATVEDTPWDDVDWSVPGTYVVTLTYTDPTTGKTVTKTVTVTIKDDVNSISQSESNADSVSKSGSGSDSISKSTSDSVSKSTSGSDSISGSGSDSISKSTSDSISKSTSGSDSISGSGSDSISKSTSDSVSKSTSGSDSISGSGSDSISKSTSDSVSKSTSGSDSISGSGSDSISKSTSDSISKSTSGS